MPPPLVDAVPPSRSNAEYDAPSTYRIYGFRVRSDLPLPELIPAEDSGPVEVTIRRGQVPADGVPDGQRIGPFAVASPDAIGLEVPRIARYLIRGGREIVVQPFQGIDADSVRVFLLGSCLGALMFQRGLLVLHGTAIQIRDGCMVCVGSSSAGKSTLAAALVRRGYHVLSDDVVPIDSDGQALPGFPRLKLWQDTADCLGISTEALSRVRPGLQKFSYPLADNFCASPVPVRWIYVLSGCQAHAFSRQPVHGLERFVPLRNHTYRLRFLDGLALRPQHLSMCGHLAKKVRLARVTRPEQGFDLDRLVDMIVDDLAAHPHGPT